MPYISKEEVKEIRNRLKKELPQLKFSVVNQDNSCVCISIMEGNIPFENLRGYEQVNQYYINENYKNSEWLAPLTKINKIASEKVKIVSYDTDYGNWPNYYVNISIGKWDKPYKLNS